MRTALEITDSDISYLNDSDDFSEGSDEKRRHVMFGKLGLLNFCIALQCILASLKIFGLTGVIMYTLTKIINTGYGLERIRWLIATGEYTSL
jgi:hypothetical protein